MEDLLARLWRARSAVTIALLTISTAVIIKGHHDAWAGPPDSYYKASLTSDLVFVACAAFAYLVAWIGAFSPAYYLCVNLVFLYWTILNVVAFAQGAYVIKGSHGCFDCSHNAERFVLETPNYVFAGILASIASRMIVGRTAATRPNLRAHLPLALLLLFVWFCNAFDLQALNQLAYVLARSAWLLPSVVASGLATAVAVRFFDGPNIQLTPVPNQGVRVGTALLLMILFRDSVPLALLIGPFLFR